MANGPAFFEVLLSTLMALTAIVAWQAIRSSLISLMNYERSRARLFAAINDRLWL